MDNMPSDITTNILSRLHTTECVLRSKCVCKHWNIILRKQSLGFLFAAFTVNSPHSIRIFFREQINEQQLSTVLTASNCSDVSTHLTYAFPQIVGSTNGLVCFCVPHHHITDPVYIMNPATGEHLHLPKLVNPARRNSSWEFKIASVAGGFGYCESTGEYKVVRCFDQGRVQVYTLGDGRGWRNKEDIIYRLVESGVSAHGCIFWIDRRTTLGIISFDLETEMFKPVSSPPIKISRNHFPVVGLFLFGLTLCVYYQLDRQDNNQYLWTPLLDDKNRLRSSTHPEERNWILQFTVELGNQERAFCCYYVPVALAKNNVLLLCRNSLLDKSLCLYDMTTKTKSIIKKPLPKDTVVEVVPHMEMGISLKSFGGVTEPCADDMHLTNHFVQRK